MKKLIFITLLVGMLSSGCAAVGMNGIIYTDVNEPITATSNEKGSKTGEATCLNVLGIVATGDCSVQAAAKAGSITTIKTIDQKSSSILGLYVKRTTIVTGE